MGDSQPGIERGEAALFNQRHGAAQRWSPRAITGGLSPGRRGPGRHYAGRCLPALHLRASRPTGGGGGAMIRVLYQMARADFLERVRRYSFLLTMVFAAALVYGAYTGTISLELGEYRGVYNSAWTGSMMTLVSTVFITLSGFYIVKNTIERDQQTRVGLVLATTPISRSFYVLAKGASNFAVL